MANPPNCFNPAIRSGREGLTWSKLTRFLALPFNPERLETWRTENRFEDIAPEALIQAGIRGVLVDADGTLGPHHAQTFSDSVVRHLLSFRELGLKTAIFTNARENRFSQLLDIPVVTHVRAKPDPEGFLLAMREVLGLDVPEQVCMVGDNFITDGGAVDAGMKFIYVRPITGGEWPWHRFFRFTALLFARMHGKVE